jgi:hypothetical protein
VVQASRAVAERAFIQFAAQWRAALVDTEHALSTMRMLRALLCGPGGPSVLVVWNANGYDDALLDLLQARVPFSHTQAGGAAGNEGAPQQ